MLAGLAKVDITPPVGTPLEGYGQAMERPSQANHDPIHVRALWVEHEGCAALIATYDFCFIGRTLADRIKGVLGRELGLLPSQVLLAATHTHAGPAVSEYYDLYHAVPLRDYLSWVEQATLHAAMRAQAARQPVRLRAGMGRSTIPMNRRRQRDGKVVNAPNPHGPVLDSLPICLMQNDAGRPVALLFTISTHVVVMNKALLSADFPGVAMDLLDEHLGTTCAMFLQGTAGDSRPALLGTGREDWNFQCGWDEALIIGRTLANETIAALDNQLGPVEPRLSTALVETHWPLRNDLTRADYLAIAEGRDGRIGVGPSQQQWARRWARLAELGPVRSTAPVLMQGIELGRGLRLIAMEGEPLHPHGKAIEAFWGVPDGGRGGATFALGYANGEAMYLVTSEMLDEGGYEPQSYWEYGQPSSLAKGLEAACDAGFERLRQLGVG